MGLGWGLVIEVRGSGSVPGSGSGFVAVLLMFFLFFFVLDSVVGLAVPRCVQASG